MRGRAPAAALDRGFVLSDHADWPELLQAIEQTGAQPVLVTHGYSSRWCAGCANTASRRFPWNWRCGDSEAATAPERRPLPNEAFAELYAALDGTTTTNEKVEALSRICRPRTRRRRVGVTS